MSSHFIPTTHCVHIFKSELDQLRNRLDTPIEDTPTSYLYGLWTHTSNIVIHLIVSDPDELKHAKAHRLDCVGYVAKEYTGNMVYKKAELPPNRQHVIVDVNETKRSNSLRAYSSHQDVFRRGENPLSQERLLQVNELASESPFRKELRKKNRPVEHELNGYKNESGNGLAPTSDVLERSTQNALNKEHILTEANKNHYRGKEMYNMSGGYDKDETPCSENLFNGHQNETETDSSLKRLLIHKIKKEFQPDKEIQFQQTRERLSFKFEHCSKQYKIQLTEDHTNNKQYVDIFFQEYKAFSQEFTYTKDVIDKIKELCYCPFCKEKIQNSMKNDQQ